LKILDRNFADSRKKYNRAQLENQFTYCVRRKAIEC